MHHMCHDFQFVVKCLLQLYSVCVMCECYFQNYLEAALSDQCFFKAFYVSVHQGMLILLFEICRLV